MDIFSLTTASSAATSATGSPRFLHSASPPSAVTTTSVSFSLNSPPPLRPPQPIDPTNSPSLRRPTSLKSTSPSSPSPAFKPSKNPLKTLLNPSSSPSPPPSPKLPSPNSLSHKLRLSGRLSPPPPPPSPPTPIPLPAQETQILEETKQEEEAVDEVNYDKFREPGKIFVGNLPSWVKKHEVSEFFRQFGPVRNVILIKGHNETERNAGFGFVIYDGEAAEKSAAKAVEFDGVEFHGRVLTVKLDDGRRLKARAEERERWVSGGGGGGAGGIGREVANRGGYYKSKWHEEREGSRRAFRRVLESQPEDWQAVVTAFDKIEKVKETFSLG